ncbi:Homeobox protein yox1 [Rhizina undulata]
MEPITEPHPSSSNSNYAFITHSQETLPLNLPPSIDNATLARRRRRRTSAHDQAILEDEYRKCDRPDKPKRKEITSRVQMGEKEVQIWFQNKRQSTRRKSKPLLPHEVIPNNGQSSSQTLPSSQHSVAEGSNSRSSQAHHHHRQIVSSSPAPHHLASGSLFSGDGCFSDEVSAQGSGAYLGLSDDTDEETLHHVERYLKSRRLPGSYSSSRKNIFASSALTQPVVPQQDEVPNSLYPTKLPPTALSSQESTMTTSAHNRLQHVLSTPLQPTKSPLPTITASSRRTNPTTPINPPRLLKRTSSSVRLTTSLEGKATVVLDEEPASSPLPRTVSKLLPPPQATPVSFSRGVKRRTVDSKIWEFYCDNQTAIRTPGVLNQPPMPPAEATQALGLIRRNSISMEGYCEDLESERPVKKARKASGTVFALPAPTPIKKKSNQRKPAARPAPMKFKSWKSARLKQPTAKKSEPTVPFSTFEPSQDSDKENRPPGAPASPPPEPRKRKATTTSTATTANNEKAKKTPRKAERQEERVLKESQTEPPAEIYNYDPPTSYQPQGQEEEGEGPSRSQSSCVLDCSQVSLATSIESVRRTPRVDEMECVENLLSLRGGTWR